MFSYLTALSYVWKHQGSNFGDLEMHIDSFKTYQGLEHHKECGPIKIFYRGDECDPFISCADIIAFLVDDMLYAQKLRLSPNGIKDVLKPYGFDTTVHFF